MTPAARVQAAIDLLDEIIIAARDNGASADIIASDYFKSRRYIGSKDRRAVRERAYQAIRRFGNVPANGRSAMLGLAKDDGELTALFDGSNYGPAKIGAGEAAPASPAIPAWIAERFYPLIDKHEYPALLGRAELDIRYNPERVTAEMIVAEWPAAQFSDTLPNAARLPAGTQVQQHPLWHSGALEIQDWGSQAIVFICQPDEAGFAIDLCAGAGGKTLGLASQMHKDSRIIASDTNRNRLSKLEPRKRRAGHENIETLLLDPNKEWDALVDYKNQTDLVLVDAPCSGTGTWRRNPETRWRLTRKRLNAVMTEQERLLDLAAKLVRPGGTLVYAVCSLIEAEGVGQIDRFLSDHSAFTILPFEMTMGRPVMSRQKRAGILLTPFHDGTDGFFMTRLIKS